MAFCKNIDKFVSTHFDGSAYAGNCLKSSSDLKLEVNT